ncbi:zinc finger protein 91 [Helicoverpa armigera]|uniref:zinc finger protein 91 n=1 Tax=Helicoverpa armigera TaxID=29058 RepID=UPI003083EB07
MSRQVDIKALVSHIVRGDGSDRCRICMGDTSEGQVHLEDTVMMDGDKPVTLAELLEVITGVEVLLDEDLPLGLCSPCSVSALQAADFRSQCRRAASQWETTLELLNGIPNHTNCTSNIVAIITENSICITKQDLKKEQESTQPPSPVNTKSENIKSTKCQCPCCGKRFLYAQHLCQHLKESSNNQRACHICAAIMTRQELIEHLIEEHKREPYDCKKCPAMFRTYTQYKTHLSKAHASGACTCGECGQNFQSQHAYYAHLSVHTPKTCPGCDELFRNQKCYHYHVKRCCNLDRTRLDAHKTKNRVTITVKKRNKDIKVGMRGSADSECICDYCKKKFAGKKFVAAHIQIVHMKNTHRPCVYCGKLLAAAHMTTHVKKHESTESFQCGHCGIILKTKLGYVQHVRLHTGERPYTCKFCGDSFSASSRRSEHIRKCHRDSDIVLKHACEFCPARFRLPYRLKKHVNSVHGEGKEQLMQFECNECHQKFSSCRGLLHHSRKHQDCEGPIRVPKLKEVVEYWMEMDPALPCSLCWSCSDDTLAAITFKNLCALSSHHWTEASNYISQVYPPTDKDKAYFIFYNQEKTIVRDQIDSVPTKKHAVERLNMKYEVEPEKPQKHRRILGVKAACKCPDCGKKFSTPDNLNHHLGNTLKRACRVCCAVVNKKKLGRHLLSQHKLHYYECNMCYKLFDAEILLKQHIKDSHDKLSHPCHVCGKSYINQRALRAHAPSHSLFHCPSCNQSYENNKCFKYHQKQCKYSDRQPVEFSHYSCDHCGVSYDRKPSLRIHMIQKHLNVLPYVCQTCGKRTSTLSHLRSHERVHKTERKIFQCCCGAKLRTEIGFQLHQRIHTGERPYTCEHCGDKFLSSSRRLDHIKRRHRGVKDLKHGCEKCSARFMTEESLIPLGACVTCASTALAAQEFRLFVRNSEKVWKKALVNLSTLPYSAAPPVKSVCAFITPDLTIQTFKDYNTSDAKTIINRLRNRVTKKTVDRKPRGARTGPSCSCPDCGKSFLSPYYLNTHLRNSGHKEACLICGSVFVRGKEMQEHLSSVHNETVFLCKKCPILCPSEVQLKKHVKKAHKAGVLTCADCGRTFPRNASFESHSQMHAVRTCRACGSQFTNRGCYREHRSQCEPDAKPNAQNMPRNRRSNIRDPATFTCDHCGKTYNSRPQLKNHILWIHMDIRPHQCQWCGKRFYTPTRLAEHTVVHTRVRNFECDICGVKLVSKMAAVYHRRRHTGERPYECEDCGEKFISASRRSEHAKRRHNKGFRLPCLKCPANFVRKHELKKHMDKAHREPDSVLSWP